MKILRHETSHAIDHAFRLNRRRRRQRLFGKLSTPYPEQYTPKALQQELRPPPRLKVQEAIGRLKERYPRVARYYQIGYDAVSGRALRAEQDLSGHPLLIPKASSDKRIVEPA